MKRILSTTALCLAAPLSGYHPNLQRLNQEIFRCIYQTNAWLDPSTRSGPGSNMVQTAVIREALPKILKTLGARSLLDLPCGDIFWINTLDLSFLDNYYGADIVPEIIEENNTRHRTGNREFMVLDVIKDELPQADVILCRDCLPHLTYRDIFSALNNMKRSGAKYLIMSTYTSRTQNNDLTASNMLHLWRYRELNFEIAPFNFPKPLVVINEGNTENGGTLTDKSLAVWRMEDVPNFN